MPLMKIKTSQLTNLFKRRTQSNKIKYRVEFTRASHKNLRVVSIRVSKCRKGNGMPIMKMKTLQLAN